MANWAPQTYVAVICWEPVELTLDRSDKINSNSADVTAKNWISCYERAVIDEQYSTSKTRNSHTRSTECPMESYTIYVCRDSSIDKLIKMLSHTFRFQLCRWCSTRAPTRARACEYVYFVRTCKVFSVSTLFLSLCGISLQIASGWTHSNQSPRSHSFIIFVHHASIFSFGFNICECILAKVVIRCNLRIYCIFERVNYSHSSSSASAVSVTFNSHDVPHRHKPHLASPNYYYSSLCRRRRCCQRCWRD